MGACCGKSDAGTSAIDSKMREAKIADSKIKKLLLLGAGGSGKSTFFKQLRIIHGNGIPQKEVSNVYKEIVQSNVITGMKNVLDALTELTTDPALHAKYFATLITEAKETKTAGFKFLNEDEQVTEMDRIENCKVYLRGQGLEDAFDEKKHEIAKVIEFLWKHKVIKKVWEHRAKFQIQDSAASFFDEISRICTAGYMPTDQHVLLARIRTTGIVEQEFTVKKNRFQVFDVGGQRNERKKWIHCFEDVTGVIFLASLSAYDQTLYEDDQTNRMTEALELFGQICNSRWFKDTAMILFLNKRDLFEEKIKKTPITVCFPKFIEEVGSKMVHDEFECKEYIKRQFLALNKRSPQNHSNQKNDQDLFCHYTCAIDRTLVQKVFRDVQNVIIHANLRRAALI